MTSTYSKLGCNSAKAEQSIPEFTPNKAALLHKLTAELTKESVQICIAFKQNSEFATVSFQSEDVNGTPQMIRIHGDYYVLRTRIIHHFGGRK